MKFSFKKVCINAPFPTTQAGHIQQTYDVTEFKDDLNARIFGIIHEDTWLIHMSCDLLGVSFETRNAIQDKIRDYYKNPKINVVVATTHTHYANNYKDEKYIEYFINTVVEGVKTMVYKEHDNDDVKVSYQKLHTCAVGKSRISGYETDLEYLTLFRFFDKDDNFFNIITYNCHPTILKATVPYFSAEYPGQVMRLLEKEYPNSNFTFMQGASGDISSRFVRHGQAYEDMLELANNLFLDINKLMNETCEKKNFKCEYQEKPLHIKHDFTPVDLSKIRGQLSEREMETIGYGKIARENLEKSGKVVKEGVMACVNFGPAKIVFFPNEIFSHYMSFCNLDEKILVSYSNGYAPYVLPIGFEYVTYEMFTDTMSKETKEEVIENIKNF